MQRSGRTCSLNRRTKISKFIDELTRKMIVKKSAEKKLLKKKKW